MGKARGLKLDPGSKRVKQGVHNVTSQVPHVSNETSSGVSTRSGKQKVTVADSSKRQKIRDHSQVQVIASILTRQRSINVPELNSQKLEQPIYLKNVKKNARRLADKVVRRTLHIASKPSRSGRLPASAATELQASNAKLDPGNRDCGMVLQSQGNAKEQTGIKIARLLRSRALKPPDAAKKVQLKTLELQGEKKRQRRRKRKKVLTEAHHDDVSRIKKRVKYLLNRMKLEQNLLDAYSAEGWKGQSREKIKPEKELQRAETQILQCKLGIREAVHQLNTLGREGSIEDSVFDSEGQIYHEDIFCAKCKSQEALPENDIILCDGACNRAFHQLCLEPPLRTEDIPPGDEGWLCPVCDCKLECLDAINAYLGTNYVVEDDWEKVFSEAAVAASGVGKSIGKGEDWPSEDSDDDDYNPEGDDRRAGQTAFDQEASARTSDSNGSDQSGEHSGSDSSDDGSEVSFFDEFAESAKSADKKRGKSDWSDHIEEPALEEEDGAVLVGRRRQRKEIDYKKLHDEMFGKNGSDEEISEDDDWGPRKGARKRKQSDGVYQKEMDERNTRSEKGSDVKKRENPEAGPVSDGKRSWARLPSHAVEKLRQVFNENPLPSRACKDELSKQLGISFRQVNFWFKNVRYSALKKGLVQSARPRTKSQGTGPTGASSTGMGQGSPTGIIAACEQNEAKESGFRNNALLEDMQRLGQAQLKIEELKRNLEVGGPNPSIDGELVVYVAVAELREKVPEVTAVR